MSHCTKFKKNKKKTHIMVQCKRTREPCQSGRIGLKNVIVKEDGAEDASLTRSHRDPRGCFIPAGKSQPADTPWGTLLHRCCKMRSQTLQKKEFSKEC